MSTVARRSVAPGCEQRSAYCCCLRLFKKHIRASHFPPTALHRNKYSGLVVHKFLLLLRREFHHRPALSRVADRGEYLAGNSKIRVTHVSSLFSFWKT